MDADNSSDHSNNNFEFAFNSSSFSDRVLKIEVVAGDHRPHKRQRREEIEGEKAADFDVASSNNKKDAVASKEAPLSQGGDALGTDCSPLVVREKPIFINSAILAGTDCSPLVVREKSIFINSAILAARSPFFYKLFSNGMRESGQQHVTLRINASEEDALMELLSFMYSGKMSTTSPPLMLDVLMVADKFEAASCVRYLCQLLKSIPMTTESAVLYLELPSSVSIPSAVQPLIHAAKEFIANKFRDISKSQDELINLPLTAIEAIFASDNLQADSEDEVYDTLMKWAKARYPAVKDRQEILRARLRRLIRFPFLSSRKILEALISPELDRECAYKAALQALYANLDTSFRLRALIVNSRLFVGRAYKYRPVQAVEFELPHPQCVVYLDLGKDECANLFPGRRVFSQPFHLRGQLFNLLAICEKIGQQQSPSYSFGLFFQLYQKGLMVPTVDYEFAARTRPSGDFVSKCKGHHDFTRGEVIGRRNVFATPWTSFMAEESPYFINGTLHLRVELTIKPQRQRNQ